MYFEITLWTLLIGIFFQFFFFIIYLINILGRRANLRYFSITSHNTFQISEQGIQDLPVYNYNLIFFHSLNL